MELSANQCKTAVLCSRVGLRSNMQVTKTIGLGGGCFRAAAPPCRLLCQAAHDIARAQTKHTMCLVALLV